MLIGRSMKGWEIERDRERSRAKSKEIIRFSDIAKLKIYTQSLFVLKRGNFWMIVNSHLLCICHRKFHSNVMNYMQNRMCVCAMHNFNAIFFSKNTTNLKLRKWWFYQTKCEPNALFHRQSQSNSITNTKIIVFYWISHSQIYITLTHPCKNPQFTSGYTIYQWNKFDRVELSSQSSNWDILTVFIRLYLILVNCCAHQYESVSLFILINVMSHTMIYISIGNDIKMSTLLHSV